jgi:ferric-dicitrate binding protein FerR (iron transport regulator)
MEHYSGLGMPELPIEIIDRYLAGTASREDRAAVDAWLLAHPAQAATFKQLQASLHQSEVASLSSTELSELVRVATRTQAGSSVRVANGSRNDRAERSRHTTKSRVAVRHTSHRLFDRPVFRSTAFTTILAAVLIIGGIAITRSRMAERTAPSNGRTYTTAAAQQAIVTLGSGSQAVLGPASKLTVWSSPSSGTVVAVTGQALFTVAHHDHAPFTVRTKNAVTRVLGTTFLVRRYATDRVTRVAVVDGRVSLRRAGGATGPGTDAVLAKRMLGIVNDSGDVRVTSDVMVEDYTAWINGRLVFHQTPVGDIVAELGRAYGVDLRIADSTLKRQAFTWTVSVTRLTLDDALAVLMTALHAHVTRSGNVLTIVPGLSASQKSNDSHIFYSRETQYGR